MKKLIFIFFIFPITSLAQLHITGRVISLTDQKPVADASVLLANTSAGAKTNADGTFTISNVITGHYELVVSIIGFQTYRENIVVNDNLAIPDIFIEQKSIALKEVRIGPDPNWDRNYTLFKYEFLGNSENAKKCKILNADVLTLNYDNDSLTAKTTEWMIIENRALGYKIKYLLAEFTKTYGFGRGMLYYAGTAFFEDLNGSKSEMRRWQKARLNTYLGSDMHFLRSATGDRVAQEGFTVRRLIRPSDTVKNTHLGRKLPETLVTTPLDIPAYMRRTDQKNVYALTFKDHLYVTYAKRKSDTPIASVISFKMPYIYFDNGVILNPESAVMEEAWGLNRMAEMLPVDYIPPGN